VVTSLSLDEFRVIIEDCLNNILKGSNFNSSFSQFEPPDKLLTVKEAASFLSITVIVRPNQFAYNPSRINVGSIDYLRTDFEVAISPLYIVFECKNNLRNDYLLRYLKSPIGNDQIRNKTRGAVRENLSYNSLLEINIPIPSIQEQGKIAKLLTKIEEIITKREESIGLLDEILISRFNRMFGDPIRNQKGFNKMQLGNLGDWKSGGTPSRSNEEYFTGDIPWLTSGELQDIYINESKEKITFEAVKNSGAKLIEEGSLLLGMYDTAALKSSITKGKVTCNQAIAYAKLNRKLCNTIFIYFLIQIGKEYFKRQQRGARQQNMNISMIKNIEVIQPPIELQDEFGEIVKKVIEIKNSHSANIYEIRKLYSAVSSLVFNGSIDLGNIHIENVIPKAIGGTNSEQNIKIRSENTKINNSLNDILNNVVIKYFKNKAFSYEELAEKIQAHLEEEEYQYDKIRLHLFASLRGLGNIKLGQFYNEEKKIIQLQVIK